MVYIDTRMGINTRDFLSRLLLHKSRFECTAGFSLFARSRDAAELIKRYLIYSGAFCSESSERKVFCALFLRLVI